MGSVGKEMDGWVKWPGAARTEKGCAARRRQENHHEFGEQCEHITEIEFKNMQLNSQSIQMTLFWAFNISHNV